MRYSITAIGEGESYNPLAEDLQMHFHLIGVLHHNGELYVTHADLKEVYLFSRNSNAITVDPETNNLVINKVCGWSERLEVDGKEYSIAWVAWYESTPDTMFFIPRSFIDKPSHFKIHDTNLGIWRLAEDVVLKGLCFNNTEMSSIVKEVM